MVFQDPFASLDPRLTVCDIITETLEIHGVAHGKEKMQRVQELLNIVYFHSGAVMSTVGIGPKLFIGFEMYKPGQDSV